MSPIAHLTRRTAFAGTLATLAATSIAGLGLSAAPALAENCPNAALRAENNSLRLPECRAYEMVTPLYKEGFLVEPQTFSDEGAFAYESLGSFDGSPVGRLQNEYVAERSSAGWTTTSPDPPPATFEPFLAAPTEGLSPDLRSSLWFDRRGEPPVDSAPNYYLRGPDGSMSRVGSGVVPGVVEGAPFTWAASADLSHILFGHQPGSGDPQVAALYEYVGTGNEGPPRPVSVFNSGSQVPAEACPAGLSGGVSRVPGMSADGRVIAFLSGCTGALPQVWARVGGSATVAVSGSQCTRTSGDPGGPCNALAPAEFAGMSTDGSRVYFTTAQQLVNGDTDQTSDLYECDIPPGAPAPVGLANPCSSLTEVSGAATSAAVQRVVSVSEDGSRVYFIANGVLEANLGTNGAAAVAGDQNLYMWQKDAVHPAGQLTFVTDLEAGIGFHPQTTADGRYLIFETASRLLPSDTDEALDVYRYDADTRTLLRLSTDTSGAAGNDPGFDATLPQPGHLNGGMQLRPTAMSSDASTVIFETAEALSPADTDGVTDVYEWHEGQVSLVSNGGARALGITRTGQDIFFSTGQPLVAGDSGTETDFYDARVDGGFPAAMPTVCTGEACHGSPPPQPPVPAAAGSATVSGAGSPLTAETPPADQPKPKGQTPAQKLARALKACRVKHNRKQRKACEKRARNTYRRAK